MCFLVASEPISLYAFQIHEVCMFKTDRYMLNALFLGFWFLGTMVLVTLGLWLLVLALCSLTLAWSLVPAWLLASGVLCSLCMNLACSDYRKSENLDWQALGSWAKQL